MLRKKGWNRDKIVCKIKMCFEQKLANYETEKARQSTGFVSQLVVSDYRFKSPLCQLSNQINWQRIEQEVQTIYTPGSGQPALPARLLVSLHYLKYMFNESHQSVGAKYPTPSELSPYG